MWRERVWRERAGRVFGHRRGAIVAAVAVAVAAAGGGTALAATGGGTPTSGPAGASAPPKTAIFTETCALARTANDDPILSPGKPGVAMRHDFFGNTAVTAGSSAASLRGGPTNCSTSADASAYWTPVLYQHGVALAPSKVLIYWRAPGRYASTTRTMPAGISMIAGNEMATAPQGTQIVRWQCQGGGQHTRASATPQNCAPGKHLRLVVRFPSCWDGHSLDGAAQTNVVYPDPSGACPAAHPVRIPQIVFHETYPTGSAAGLTLSMGPGRQGSTDTAHADFINGWDQPKFDAVVKTCITGGKACGRVSGADATPAHPQDLVPPKSTARHQQARPGKRLGALARRSLHAAYTVRTKTGYATVLVQRGMITAWGGGKVTVTSTDHYAHTYTVTAGTHVRVNGAKASASKLAVGQRAMVATGPKTGTSTALAVVAHTPKTAASGH